MRRANVSIELIKVTSDAKLAEAQHTASTLRELSQQVQAQLDKLKEARAGLNAKKAIPKPKDLQQAMKTSLLIHLSTSSVAARALRRSPLPHWYRKVC